MNELDEIREKIESIDKEMARLFEERFACSRKVAQYKSAHGIPVLDKDREKKLVERNLKYIGTDENAFYYEKFIQNVMDLSKEYQYRIMRGKRVAYSGIEGSFSYSAATKLFPGWEAVSHPSFESAYNSVENGECDAVVLPIENSYAGEVGQVTDLMYGGTLLMDGIYELPVTQCLLGVKGSSLETIKTVMSHPQALAQCEDFLKQHDIATIPDANTAVAAKKVSDGKDITLGAIAASENASLYGLEIIAEGINESESNVTRFAVLSKKYRASFKDDSGNSFVLMFTVKNNAGTLARAIAILGKYGYSMRVIRSRPDKNVNWQYFFYAEVEGHPDTEAGSKMLEELKEECELIKVLGTFKPGLRIV